MTNCRCFHATINFSYKQTSGGWKGSSTTLRMSRRRESGRTLCSNNRSIVSGEKLQLITLTLQFSILLDEMPERKPFVILRRKTLDESEWSSCAKSGEISFLQSQIAQDQLQDVSGETSAATASAGNGSEVSQSVAGLSVQVSENQVHQEPLRAQSFLNWASFHVQNALKKRILK